MVEERFFSLGQIWSANPNFLVGYTRGVRSVEAEGAYAPDVLKQQGHMPPSKHAPVEIPNSMFLPLMKKV